MDFINCLNLGLFQLQNLFQCQYNVFHYKCFNDNDVSFHSSGFVFSASLYFLHAKY